MATLQIRLDDSLKSESDALFLSLGMDTSTAVRIFLKSSIENNGIPFPIQHNADFSIFKAISDARTNTNLKGPFCDAESAVKSMLED